MTLIDKIKLAEGEKVFHVVRHWIGLLLSHFVFCFLIVMFDFFLMFYLFSKGIFGALVFLLILTIVAVYSGRLVFLWRRNIMVITNKRLIDWEQTGFFEQSIREIPFADIESVEAEHKGFLGKIFKFGNLTFKMKSEQHPFVLYKVKFPLRASETVKRALSGSGESLNSHISDVRKDIETNTKTDVETNIETKKSWEDLLVGVKKLSLEEKKALYREFKRALKEDLRAAISEE